MGRVGAALESRCSDMVSSTFSPTGEKKLLREKHGIRRHTGPETRRQLINLTEEEMKAVRYN